MVDIVLVVGSYDLVQEHPDCRRQAGHRGMLGSRVAEVHRNLVVVDMRHIVSGAVHILQGLVNATAEGRRIDYCHIDCGRGDIGLEEDTGWVGGIDHRRSAEGIDADSDSEGDNHHRTQHRRLRRSNLGSTCLFCKARNDYITI